MKSFKSFTITNKLEIQKTDNLFDLFIDNKITKSNTTRIFVKGYVLPRINSSITFDYDNIELSLKKLYKKFGNAFIKYVKGNFIILVIDKDNFHIFTDRIGIKKVFYWEEDQEFIISNNIDNIINRVNTNISKDNIFIHSIMHHFVDGITMFKNIHYTKNAGHLYLKNNQLKISQYWKFDQLLELDKQKISYKQFSLFFSNLIKNYIKSLDTSRVSISLTGGMDSRTILSELSHNNINPLTFTFGNPQSKDVVVAKKIADDLNLVHNNYFTEQTAKTYNKLVNEIIKTGNTITHLHRAHRLDAIKKHNSKYPGSDLLFVGHMGGEGIRGLTYNNYFASALFENVNENNYSLMYGLQQILKKYYHLESEINIDYVHNFINNLSYFSHSKETNKFYFLYELVAHVHHAQDLNIYSRYIKNVIPIYLDIDYLELLFSSSYNMLQKQPRLQNPELYCEIINELDQRLSTFLFSNNFSPKEYLKNKYICALKKKIRDFKKSDKSNFGYNEWFEEFIDIGLTNLHPKINAIFNYKKLKDDFYTNQHRTDEGYWHKYSNPIMFSKIFKHIENL